MALDLAHPPGSPANVGLARVGSYELRGCLAWRSPVSAFPRRSPAVSAVGCPDDRGRAPNDGLELVERHKEAAGSSGFWPSDPIFSWFRDEVTSPVVVLASDVYSARIPSYSSEANVISRRGTLVLRGLPELKQRVGGHIEVPQGSLDVQEFFYGTDLETGVEILRCNKVDFVMIRSDSRLNRAVEKLAGFEPVREPSKRYEVYSVDLPTPSRLLNTPESSRIPLPPQ